jgi:hypothetical protein
MAWIWCSTAGVLRLNTLAKLLGLSGSIFIMKTAPWFCHRWWNHLCRKHTTKLVAIFITSKTWHRNGAGQGGGNLGNKVTNTFPLSSANLTELHDMLTCQADMHYLHTEPESSLSKQTDRPKLKKTRMQNCGKHCSTHRGWHSVTVRTSFTQTSTVVHCVSWCSAPTTDQQWCLLSYCCCLLLGCRNMFQ